MVDTLFFSVKLISKDTIMMLPKKIMPAGCMKMASGAQLVEELAS